MKIDHVKTLLAAVVAFGVITPAVAQDFDAFAKKPKGAPAPIAGLGFGAAVAVGAGYRALKRRTKR